MRVAHIGPPLARLGGPAGYLFELARAASSRDPRGHEVTFPEAAPPAGPPRPLSPLDRARQEAGRLKRRLLGPPKLYRPSLDAFREPGGQLERAFQEAAREVRTAAEASLAATRARGGAHALFAHDVFLAEHLLRERRPGEKVWMMVHAPMPWALYHAWSFGLPELPWPEFLDFPDVRAWIDRELAVWQRVDRLLLPCAEAGDEVVRVEPAFAAPLERADHLLTGTAGAPRPGAEAAPKRRFWRLPEREPVGLYLGNAQPYRGLDTLLAAMDELPGQKALPGVVAVAGPPPDSLPRHPRLAPLGRVADISELLRAVDFVINVNRFSLFDLSTIEAVEAGRPLLLHATGGNRTFRDLGAGAVTIGDLEPATVAGGLRQLFTAPPERLAELGRASRACYEAHLTPGHFWQRHLDLYDRAERAGEGSG